MTDLTDEPSAVAQAVAAETPVGEPKAPRKRAVRKKAADPMVGPTTPEAGADEQPSPEADDLATVSKPVRKRASRAKKSAETLVATAVAEAAEALAAPASTPGEVQSGPVAAPAAEPAADSAPPSVGFGGGLGMLLFQAPEPTRAPTTRKPRTAPIEPPLADLLTSAPLAQAPQDLEHPEEDLAPDVDEELTAEGRKRRRRGGRGRRSKTDPLPPDTAESAIPVDLVELDVLPESSDEDTEEAGSVSSRRRRRRRRTTTDSVVVQAFGDEVTSIRGSTRLEAKKQRRRDGRETHRRKPIITEAEFLARRESVERRMVVRERQGRIQIGVLEDDVLVEHYVANETNASIMGNIFLGRVQTVLPSMEAAFVDIGKGRNAVLYAGEVNWDAAGLDGTPRRIEAALKAGDQVLVQVTKDPMGHKGARLTSQISLPGRYLVYVPNGSMTGISRKLPDIERSRLKKILKQIVPEEAGVIVRTAAEGASAEELERDVERLTQQWAQIEGKSVASTGKSGPKLLHGEPDLMVRVIRDIFNEDFVGLVVSGETAWSVIQPYIASMAPDLADRVIKWTSSEDVFAAHRIDEQLTKAMDRQVFLPSGGSLVIDRTEAMTVVDVNTGRFTGAGGNLEETVTRNNLESAEEIVRQLRLRDIGGIIVIDFIDMVLESNRDLVLRRLLECLGRDRTKHQVAEVTSLGLVQMTRKRVGQGLLEVFSEPCHHCNGRGVILSSEPVSRTTPAAHAIAGYQTTARTEVPKTAANRGSAPRGRGRDRSETTLTLPMASPSLETPPVPAMPPRQPMPAGLIATLSHPEQPAVPAAVTASVESAPPTPAAAKPRRRRASAPAGPPQVG